MKNIELTVDVTPKNRVKLFEELYERTFPIVAHFVNKMNGSFQDAKDIFQDALVIYYEKIEEQHIILNSSPEPYILGIAKHLWVKKFKKDNKKISLDTFESSITIPHDHTPTLNQKRLLQFLEKAGRKCLDLLHSFYYDHASMKDVAAAHGYRNEHSAIVQKYKCLEKIRNTVKQKSLAYEDFLE